MYMMSGVRDSRCTLYPGASPGQLVGTPSSGLMKLSSSRFNAGFVSSQSSRSASLSQMFGSEGSAVLGKIGRRIGSRMKMYTGMKYRIQVKMLESFGTEAILPWIRRNQ
jgi:hypothetical protein